MSIEGNDFEIYFLSAVSKLESLPILELPEEPQVFPKLS